MKGAIGADSIKVSHLRAQSETVLFPANWPWLIEDLQHSIYDTAHSRYQKWWRPEAPKRKQQSQQSEPGPLGKRPACSGSSPGNLVHTVPTEVPKRRTAKKKAKSRK